MKNAESTVVRLLENAGITVNGKNPGDIQVHNKKFYSRVLGGGSLGLGESYMDGWWDCRDLHIFFEKLLGSRLKQKLTLGKVLLFLQSFIGNLQSKVRAFQVGREHYDLGNDLYEKMLGSSMAYSCGYWKNAKSLTQAQNHKFDLICRKLKLKKGMTVLDIGCGWGGFAKYAATKYGVKVTGLTISKEQAKYAKHNCRNLDVEIRVQDYRDLNEQFDAILSIGMFEHVGVKNYQTYFESVRKNLAPGGLSLLHTIGANTTTSIGDLWFHKYIFPNGKLPSAKHITKNIEGIFVLEDWHNFGPDYAKTLLAWDENFEKHWPKIKSKYSKRFYRMWKYYLLCCAGSFKARHIQLWQVVMSKGDIKNVYESVR